MSRNLGRTNCDYCDDALRLEEAARPITREDAGAYFEEYEGMLVAAASCPSCGAEYLAWVDARQCASFGTDFGQGPEKCGFFDLSYRSAFNDEPGERDRPKRRVRVRVVRECTAPYDGAPVAQT